MMIGERNRAHPTVKIPPWTLLDDPTADMRDYVEGGSEHYLAEALSVLQHYLPSNESDTDICGCETDIPVDPYSCDQFRMYEFKVRRCSRGRSHDWTDCPYAHPGEKARRRDPRKFLYSGTACPDYRKGSCKKGDTCEFSHGVFECWLHPDRYRTQPCKDGTSCRRRVCFFAHTPEQLRVVNPQSPRVVVESPPSYDGSPLRQAIECLHSKGMMMMSSGSFTPPGGSPPSESPPMSPCAHHARSLCSIGDLTASLRHLQLSKMKSVGGLQIGSGFLSPRAGVASLRPGFSSLPTTPTQQQVLLSRSGMGRSNNLWDVEEPVMDRVESGKALRAQIYEKLSKENSLDRGGGATAAGSGGPDVEWVSDLIN